MIVRMAAPADAAMLAALSLRTFVDAFAADNRAEDMGDLQTDWVMNRTL